MAAALAPQEKRRFRHCAPCSDEVETLMNETKLILAAVKRLLWKDRWLERFIWLTVTFSFLRYVVSNLATALLGQSAASVFDRVAAVRDLEALKQILADSALVHSLVIAAGLSLFISALMGAITSFGLARARLNAVESIDTQLVTGGAAPGNIGWQRGVWGGFRDPFGMLMLAILHGIAVYWPCAIAAALATLLAPGVSLIGAAWPLSLALACLSIPRFYRYRMAWLEKASDPSLGALECLRRSAARMRGNIGKCFRLDCAMWKEISALLAVFMLLVAVCIFGTPVVAAICALLYLVVLVYVEIYVSLAQTVFYCIRLKAPAPSNEA